MRCSGTDRLCVRTESTRSALCNADSSRWLDDRPFHGARRLVAVLWDTVIRTDTEPLTKRKLEYNAKNLDDFAAFVCYTGGTLEMDARQQADFLSFVHDDGKGFIGIH